MSSRPKSKVRPDGMVVTKLPKQKGVSKKTAAFHKGQIPPDVWRVMEMIKPKPQELLVGHRHYVREGPIQMFSRADRVVKPRYLFLLSDGLLVSKRESQKKFWLKTLVTLKSRGLDPARIVFAPRQSNYVIPNVEFHVHTPSATLVFFAQNTAQRDRWITYIRMCIQSNNQAIAAVDAGQEEPEFVVPKEEEIDLLDLGFESTGPPPIQPEDHQDEEAPPVSEKPNEYRLSGVSFDPFAGERHIEGEHDSTNPFADGAPVDPENPFGTDSFDFSAHAVVPVIVPQASVPGFADMDGAGVSDLEAAMRKVALAVQAAAASLCDVAPGVAAGGADTFAGEGASSDADAEDDVAAAARAAVGGVSGPQLDMASYSELDKSIMSAARALTNATTALVVASTDAQREVWAKAGEDGETDQSGSYKADPAWEQGLISASQAVADNIVLLVESANNVVQNNEDREKLVACSRSVSGATARLVTASTVKLEGDSSLQKPLTTAASEVKRATVALEAAVKASMAAEEEKDAPQANPGAKDAGRAQSVMVNAQKVEALTKMVRLEQELERARREVGQLNKSEYV